MSPLARIGIGALGALVLVAAVVAVRTATFDAPGASAAAAVALADPVPADLDAAARHLAEAVRFRTVSHQDPAENDWGEWDRFHAWLEATYPAAHGAMNRELAAGRTLVYTWPGSDPSRRPIVLLAHHDVVPVTPGTEGDWQHPPFDGIVADGAIWGRGAVDDKGSLVGLFEALDAAAELLKKRHVKAEFVLDEGLAVVADIPPLSRPVALVGIAEKGYGTLRITAPAKGGHSSTPPPETGVEVLAKAVLAITSRPFPLRFEGPAADMVRALRDRP
jgi:carboxypeptidase PM20D1